MFKKTVNSFGFAWNGLKSTWREEHNFRIEIIGGFIVLFCLFYFDFSFVESAFSIVAVTIVICAEILNTAMEDLCNKVEPKEDVIIGKIKDMMAGFVLISGVGAVVLGILIFFHHFLSI